MKRKRVSRSYLGNPNFFDDRHKRQLFQLAKIKPSDVFYDLGCGYGQILILAVKEFGVKKAVGYEIEPKRAKKARDNIEKEKLSDKITIYTENMHNADLTKADVIFSMHVEYAHDYKKMWSQKIKKGTHLIKHDLPLLGYIPDKIDIPFYRMTFPLKKAKSQNHWASIVLAKKNSKISDVWHELAYHGYEKCYRDSDIARFKKIISWRLKK